MTYGFEATNNSSQLTVTSESPMLRFLVKPTAVSAGYITQSEHIPHRFNVNTAGVDDPPVVFIKPNVDTVTRVDSIYHLGGTSWQINVHCVSIVSYAEDMRNTPQATPEIYVFCKMSNSGAAYGLQLFNSAGQVTFDTNYRPLWIRGVLSLSQKSGYKYSYGSWVNYQFFNGDTVAFSGYTKLGVLACPTGDADCTTEESGEAADYWFYGWAIVGGVLKRHRYWAGSYRGYHSLNWSTDSVTFRLGAINVLTTELNGL